MFTVSVTQTHTGVTAGDQCSHGPRIWLEQSENHRQHGHAHNGEAEQQEISRRYGRQEGIRYPARSQHAIAYAFMNDEPLVHRQRGKPGDHNQPSTMNVNDSDPGRHFSEGGQVPRMLYRMCSHLSLNGQPFRAYR